MNMRGMKRNTGVFKRVSTCGQHVSRTPSQNSLGASSVLGDHTAHAFLCAAAGVHPEALPSCSSPSGALGNGAWQENDRVLGVTKGWCFVPK